MNSTVRILNARAKKAICMACACVVMLLVSSSVAWGQWGTTPGTQNISNTNSGNVGIGTPNPADTLTVSTSSPSNNPLTLINTAPSGFTQMVLQGTGRTWGVNVGNASNSTVANKFSIFDAGAFQTRFIIDTSGNIGIGTTNPIFKLHIATGADVYNAFRMVAPDNHFAHISPSMGAGSFNPITQTGDTAIIYGNGTSTPGPASLVIAPWSSSLSGLRMDSTGSVGIGTATPWERLAVMDGNIGLYGSTLWSGNLRLTSAGASGSWRFAPCNNVGDVNCPPSGFVIHQEGVGTRMAFLPNGNVGIGTIGANYKLEVAGTVGLGQASLTNSDVYFTNPNHNHTGFGNAAGFAAIENAVNYNTLMILGRSGGIGGVRSVSIWDRLDVNGNLNATGSVGISGSVGIGTPASGYKLDVQGGSINASGGLCIAGDCKSAWSQLGGGSSQWTSTSNNLSYTAGNVVIGTVSPAGYTGSTLDVNGGFFHTTVNSQVFPTSSGAGGLAIGWNRTSGFAEVNFYNVYNNAHTAFQFSQKTGLDASGHETAADLLTIMGDGKVGIGTAAPTAALEVIGSIKVSGNINAKYQDVAEWVPSSQRLVAGTVVVLDSQSSNHVIASTREYDTAVAGVVSEKPGISLGESGEGRLLVATTGRVLVQVDASRAPIRVGDLLVTSGNSGMAMRSEPLDLGGTRLHRPGTLIGKALEPLNAGTGKILVLLSLQ